MKRSRWLVLGCLAVISGCSSVTEMRMGRHPPREDGCSLQLVAVSFDDMKPGGRFAFTGGEYDLVGTISIRDQKDPSSEEVRRIVRKRACAMGGEVVSIAHVISANNSFGVAGSILTFHVWAHPVPASSAPTKF